MEILLSVFLSYQLATGIPSLHPVATLSQPPMQIEQTVNPLSPSTDLTLGQRAKVTLRQLTTTLNQLLPNANGATENETGPENVVDSQDAEQLEKAPTAPALMVDAATESTVVDSSTVTTVSPTPDADPTAPDSPDFDPQLAQPNSNQYSLGGVNIPALQQQLDHVVSWDILKYDLASTDNLERQPVLSPSQFEPATGVQFNEDGSVTIKVLTGNRKERLTVIGDFNQWGKGVNLKPYQLKPTAADPEIQAVTLPPGDYHLSQYRLVDQKGNQRLHLSADVFSTPAFNHRFYEGDRRQDTLNAVIWQPTPIPAEELAPAPDLRGKSLVIAEVDMISLALNWMCTTADSPFYGQTGADNISELFMFVAQCGLPEKMADLGYNVVQFMPLDTHVDFWEPDAPYFPDWRYSYQSINFFGKHADFGSPDELRYMINAFHRANVGVILDVVYGHFPNEANNPPREFDISGFTQFKRPDGSDLYSGGWTEWGTRRFRYAPEVRRYLVDAALINILRYGFDGLRIDNINGIDREPYGRELIREISAAVQKYSPQTILIGEGYFGDWYLNHALSVYGGGLTTTYSDEFYLWFTHEIIRSRTEIDIWKLDTLLNLDWPRTLVYYSGNHDEFANPGNPFQARGRYLVQAIDGGDFHNQKIRSWSAMAMFAGSYFLDMFQQWTLQTGGFSTNAAIEWQRLDNPVTAKMVAFQSDLKKFFQSEPAFAPYNIHGNMIHWIDNTNKVIAYERINFETGKRVYLVANLADQAIAHYTIPVYPEVGTFQVALDTDRVPYGGQDRNPATVEVSDRALSFFLDSYGVVALVEQ